jgi:predicted phosphodiesterase
MPLFGNSILVYMASMKRRKFFGTVAGGAAIGGAGLIRAAEAAAGERVRSPAVLMAPREDGAEVVWAVSGLCRGHVEWKGEDGSSGRAGADCYGMVPQGEEILRVRLDGLKAGMKYDLRTVTEGDGNKTVGEWKPFQTLDPAAKSTTFVIWNDTHQNDETIRRLHQSTPRGDFLIWNGDTCNDWHQEDWLVPTLLNPAGQDVSAGRPLFLVWGNHDVRGKWAFRLPEMIATPDGRPYYAFRSGPVAAICLHTGEDKPDSHPSFGGRVAFDKLRSDQTEWLKEVTAVPAFRDAPYRVAFCHIPLRWKVERKLEAADYESGGYDYYSRRSRDAWHESLVGWGVQVVISGHTHQAALLPANTDFPYAQLVGGGPKPEQATWIEGKADGKELKLEVRNLEGNILHELTLPAMA